MTTDTGSIELGNPATFWIRRVFVAGGAGGIGGAFYFANLSNYLELKWELGQLASHYFQPREYISSFVFFGIVASAISAAAWWLRQPHGARVSWDATAITEHDGNAIRACIPWSTALLRWVEVWIQKKGGERTQGGAILQLSDPSGRRITVNGSSLSYGWMQTRRLVAQTFLTDLWKRASGLPSGDPLTPDPASLKRPSFRLWSFLTFAATVAITIGLFLLHREREAPLPIAGGALVLILTTVLVPVRERWRLREAPAERVELDGRLDLAGLVHPDALIATRRGGHAWVTRSADGKVAALETEEAREARQTLARAVTIEIVLRLLIVAALIGLLVAQELARRRTRGY